MSTEAVVVRCGTCTKPMRVGFERAPDAPPKSVTFSCAGCGASITERVPACAGAVQVAEFSTDSNQPFDFASVETVIASDGAICHPAAFHHVGGGVMPWELLLRAPLPETVVFATSPQETRGYRLHSASGGCAWYSESEYLLQQVYAEVGRRLDAEFPDAEPVGVKRTDK